MTVLSGWRSVVASSPLAPGEVHVWRVAIGAGQLLEPFWKLLSSGERARANELRDERHRAAYVASHVAMRRILVAYTGTAPEELRFAEGPFGKPSLAEQSADRRIEFNLTHSGDIALLAVARDRAVGIDIVQWNRGSDHAGIASRVFTPREQAGLLALAGTGDRYLEAFYTTWARKEAYCKATGEGLSRGPRDSAPDPAVWATTDIDTGYGYSAALVVAKPAGEVILLDAPGGLAASE